MCHNCASMVRLWSILIDGDLKGFKFILSVFLFLFLFVLLNLFGFFSSFTVGPLWILAKCVNVLYVVNQIGRKLHGYATHRKGNVSFIERLKLCNYTKTIPKEDCPLGVHF